MKKTICFLLCLFGIMTLFGCATASPLQSTEMPDLPIDGPAFILFYSENWLPWEKFKPVVDELEAEYGDTIKFSRIDVRAGNNESMQNQSYGVRGHPSVVIVSAENEITARFFGAIDETKLKPAIEAIR